ncbi:tRNA dihydrouridine(20/20a) synthase DusA [candidate division KSB1 bacterium]|nr:tRNA dihydrouridine(20/20a) synthase DusA [candidate division KSB1 bacterium]
MSSDLSVKDLDFPLSIAPMMKLTDRHFRYFMRLITRYTVLYSEMITTFALLRGNRDKLLAFDPVELPLVLQLGGSDAQSLALCARMAQEYGFSAVNLNAGCPSPKVQKGEFGIKLMKNPDFAAELYNTIKNAVTIPVSVKHRLGIENKVDYEQLYRFIERLAAAGCCHFIIHARIADLNTLDAKQNRKIPPLRHTDVYHLKKTFPGLIFELNGGVTTLKEAREHLCKTDKVMIGRAAYADPYLFANADSFFKPGNGLPPTRRQVIERIIPYLQKQEAEGINPLSMLRHLMGLFRYTSCARAWRRYLSESVKSNKPVDKILEHAQKGLPSEILDDRARLSLS